VSDGDLRATLERLTVRPGSPAHLDRRDPCWDGGPAFHHLAGGQLREEAQAVLARSIDALEAGQEKLWADGRRALLIVLQAMDAAGKDGTIKHVMSGVNPAGVEVVSFKQPSTEELAHDFLWRIERAMPARGRIAIFNHSHYEEVVAVRVHPEWLERQQLPPGDRGEPFWRERFESLFLHVSKEEQRRRLLARLDEPEKEWKFSASDVAERAHWDAYMAAYDAAIGATSTRWAPWHVVPADRTPLLRALAAEIIVAAIGSLDLRWPEVSEAQRAADAQARDQLAAEGD
jgi:polyphosphate kinase 2 (PPK2 family)